MSSDLVWWKSNRVTKVEGNRRNGVGGSSLLSSSFSVFSLRENRNWQKRLRMRLRMKRRGCVTAVQFILFNFASYSPSIAMELKVSKQITCTDTSRKSRQTNMSPEHYFEVANSRDQLWKTLRLIKRAVLISKTPNFNPLQSSSVLPIRGICCMCCVILTFL